MITETEKKCKIYLKYIENFKQHITINIDNTIFKLKKDEFLPEDIKKIGLKIVDLEKQSKEIRQILYK